jgi:hypothetical protein
LLELKKLKPVPDTRQKVDGFMVFDTGSPEDQESLQTKSKYNLRKSLAWDSAFFTSPGMLTVMKKLVFE